MTNFDFYLQECKLDIYKLKFKKKLINNKLKFGVNMKMKGEVQRDVDSQINHVVRFVQKYMPFRMNWLKRAFNLEIYN